MKNRFSFAIVATLIIALTLPAFVLAQQTPTPDQGRTGATTSTTTTSRQPASPLSSKRVSHTRLSNAAMGLEQDFKEALTVIQDNYVDGKTLKYNDVYKSSIIGMLRSLDPHSNYYDREEFDELRTDQRSEYFGIGASISTQTVGDKTNTYIAATFEGTPAARGGLRFGDMIKEVDGQPMKGKSTADVRDKIRGPRGSVVKITIEHAATGRTDIVELTRDVVPQPSIPDAYMIRPGVGYIDMTRGFNFTTSDELQSALVFLRGRGMTSLVLDLRNNPGGFLDQSIRVAENFLRDGQLILTQKGRDGVGDKSYQSRNPNPDTTPLVILVNGGTASASEIVSGAMQDHDRAVIVGQTTFGKGLVQSIINLEYGAGLTLTSAKYYTPSGRLIQRDYSNGGFYDYYTHGGTFGLDQRNDQAAVKPSGPESRTDTGRVVYGGGGITPDETIKPRTVSSAQLRLLNPIFFFTRELANGRIAGFDAYKIQNAINYDHRLQPTEYPVNDALYKAFKDFVAKEPGFKTTPDQLDRNRAFAELEIRFNLATAAYGSVTAAQVRIQDDPQVAKAIESLPRARELAMTAMRARNQP